MGELVSVLVGRIRATARDYVVLALAGGVGSVLVLTAYVALVYAAALAVATEAGPIVAALTIAGGSTVLALVLWLAVVLHRRRLKRRRRLQARRTASLMSNTVAASLIPMMVRASPAGSLLAVGVLAYVLSRTGGPRRGDR